MTKVEQNINKLNIAIEKLTILEEQNKQRIDSMETRVRDIEDKPIKAYEKHKEAIIASICSGIGGIILAALVAVIIFFVK